jgi:hypothetical protein
MVASAQNDVVTHVLCLHLLSLETEDPSAKKRKKRKRKNKVMKASIKPINIAKVIPLFTPFSP